MWNLGRDPDTINAFWQNTLSSTRYPAAKCMMEIVLQGGYDDLCKAQASA